VVGIFAPIIITGLFIAIWVVYLWPLDNDRDSTFLVGPPGASHAYYSWFITGVLGLNLSLYGLNAAESGMLLSKTQDGIVPEALLRHDKYVAETWSGPGGWTKTARRVMSHFRNGTGCASCPSALLWRGWFCLTLPSVLVFIALPLPDLSFEPDSGFIRGLAGTSEAQI
jgi:hypothetical protein